MTREQNILSEMNREEMRLKRAVEENNNAMVQYHEGKIEGFTRMLTLLSYRVEKEEIADLNGYSIYRYTKVYDVR